MIDLRLLIKNGVHFGHQTSRWCPQMKPFIWGSKNDIHLIDVSKTAHALERAAKFLEEVAAEGRTILWVGTKKAAQQAIERAAQETNSPSVEYRWVGGAFTNNRMVRKAIGNLIDYEGIIEKSEQFPYKKKELNTLKKRVARLDRIVGGIKNLSWPVGAVVVVDVKKEHVCIKEARAVGIPIVAIVDTNGDPTGIDFPIPGNDDAPRSVALLIDYLIEATKKGKESAASKPQLETPLVDTYEKTAYHGFEGVEDEDAAKKRSASGGPRRHRKPGSPAPQGSQGPQRYQQKPSGQQQSAQQPTASQPEQQASSQETSAQADAPSETTQE
ncbi:30S ribosomal protein S2 [Candidatus Dependentiae bacterium]|nr:30S ribosomal protein S2 [Candidatus Dependentiae bacterium]